MNMKEENESVATSNDRSSSAETMKSHERSLRRAPLHWLFWAALCLFFYRDIHAGMWANGIIYGLFRVFIAYRTLMWSWVACVHIWVSLLRVSVGDSDLPP